MSMSFFAAKLFELREKHNLSQQELADALGISRQSLGLYEKAERTINIDVLVRIAQYFNVSTDYLLGLSNAHSIDPDTQAVCKKIGCSEEALNGIIEIFDGSVPDSYSGAFLEAVFSTHDKNAFNLNALDGIINCLLIYIKCVIEVNDFAKGISDYKGNKKLKAFCAAKREYLELHDEKDRYEWQLLKAVLGFADIVKDEYVAKIGQEPYFDDFMEQELAKEESIRKPDGEDE